MKILYYIPEQTINDPVIKSQVIDQATFLSKNNYEIFIYAQNTKEHIVEGLIKMFFHNKNHKNPTIKSIITIFQGIKTIKKINPDYVYFRSSITFFFLYLSSFLFKSNLVFDARGVSWEERYMKTKKKNVYYFFLKFTHIFAYKLSHRQLCVTNNFAQLIKKYRKKDDLYVIPSCLSLSENENHLTKLSNDNISRASLGFLETDIIICYSGSTTKWQRIDKICELVNSLNHSNIKLLCMTKEIESMQIIVSEILQSNQFVIKSANNKEELSKYLNLVDFGIIIRDNSLVNMVASPIKIAEYFHAGLPIICNKYIGDIEKILKENPSLGILIDDTNHLLNTILTFKKYNKKMIQSYSIDNYTWNAYLKIFQDCYR
ncbi:MAG TPA: hypothetical protein PLD76_03005 [Paludibacteraceae bacterium]|nr:hypothetical protein [Paludibacteraceae bacterium]